MQSRSARVSDMSSLQLAEEDWNGSDHASVTDRNWDVMMAVMMMTVMTGVRSSPLYQSHIF